MCILFLAINQHPKYPLIVAANRDEYYSRPCEPMHYWPDLPDVLAGRDSLKGGSWLGVNRRGRFGAVTNFRTGTPPKENADSRGELVQRFLADQEPAPEFISFLERNHRDYNPFNLVFGRDSAIYAFCSVDGSLHALDDGYHSLSNGYLDQHWPKMETGIARITALIENSNEIDIDELNKLMRDETKAGADSLPSTGVSPELEQHLSSIFIRGEDYGTRTTSYLLFTESSVHAHEINYDTDASITGQSSFSMELVR